MDVRILSASLLLCSFTLAQAEPPAGSTPATPPAAEVKAQDPDKPGPKAVDVIGELTREKERLQKEIEYAKNRVKSAKGDLAQKLGTRGQSFKAIDAGTSAAAAPAAPPQMQKARVMSEKELAAAGQDVMLTVDGNPIKQGVFDELMNYLRTSPTSGDDNLRAQRVLFDLIRTESVVAKLPENGALGQAGDVLGQLQSGKPMADLAKSVGTVPGANPEGALEVTRNSHLGCRFEHLAFTSPVGQLARPFHTPQGIVILQVDSLEKGATPEADKAKVHAVLIPWQTQPEQLQRLQGAAAMGQVDIAVRSQQVLDMLPALFKPMAAVAAPNLDNELATMQDTLKQIDATIEKLKGAELSPDQKQQYEAMLKQREALQQAITELQAKAHDGAAAVDTVVQPDGSVVPKKEEKKQ